MKRGQISLMNVFKGSFKLVTIFWVTQYSNDFIIDKIAFILRLETY